MTRSVADAAIVLGVLAGPDPRDPATADAHAHSDHARFLEPAGCAVHGSAFREPCTTATAATPIASCGTRWKPSKPWVVRWTIRCIGRR
nr:hypothetical protein [Herbihabitans rhizosphaerae]